MSGPDFCMNLLHLALAMIEIFDPEQEQHHLRIFGIDPEMFEEHAIGGMFVRVQRQLSLNIFHGDAGHSREDVCHSGDSLSVIGASI